MNFFLHLSTCNLLNLSKYNIEIIDVKKTPINLAQICGLKSLINKRAQLLKQKKIDSKKITELEAKELLNDHYTFLKRPILFIMEGLLEIVKREKLCYLLFFLRVVQLYGLNHTIAKEVMPNHVGAFGFIFIRTAGATILFWFASLFVPFEKIDKKDYIKLFLLHS